MAKVLICHVPKDGSSARELGGALMGRDHFVSFDGEPDAPRADRSTRLRHFEAVIVLWTETSHQSAGLAAIARETLPLNLLIPVRAEDLAVTRLPLMFRKLHMFAPRDVDGIARLIARLSTAASSLKDMVEQAARIGSEPKWERQVPYKTLNRPAMMPEAKSPVIERAPPPSEPAPIQSTLPEVIIPAAHAQHTSHLPAHLGLPEVGESGGEPAVALERKPPPPRPPEAPAAHAPRPAPKPPVAAPLQPRPAQVTSQERMPLAQRMQSPQHAKTAAPSMPVQLADTPARYSAIANAQDLSDAVEAGLLLHYIPEKMWLGEPGAVEVRLVRTVLDQFFHVSAGKGTTVESLSISLYGTGEAFEIERLSERTQRVAADPGKSPLTQGDAAERWTWHVTPLSAGTQDLVVRVSALLLDRHGVPAPVALPDRRFRVEIDVPEGSRFMSSLAGWRRR